MNNLERSKHDLRKLLEQVSYLRRDVAVVEEAISVLKQHIYQLLGEPQVSCSCQGIHVNIHQTPKIENYQALEAYIYEKRAIDLLQKRLTESAVKFRWDDGQIIPGVKAVQSFKLILEP